MTLKVAWGGREARPRSSPQSLYGRELCQVHTNRVLCVCVCVLYGRELLVYNINADYSVEVINWKLICDTVLIIGDYRRQTLIVLWIRRLEDPPFFCWSDKTNQNQQRSFMVNLTFQTFESTHQHQSRGGTKSEPGCWSVLHRFSAKSGTCFWLLANWFSSSKTSQVE